MRLYFIYHHGVCKSTLVPTYNNILAFNFASELICDEERTWLTLCSYIHKQGPVQQRVDEIQHERMYIPCFVHLSPQCKKFVQMHDFNYHNIQTCKKPMPTLEMPSPLLAPPSLPPPTHTPCPCPEGPYSVSLLSSVPPDSGHTGLPSAAWYRSSYPSHAPLLHTREPGIWWHPDSHLVQHCAWHWGHPTSRDHTADKTEQRNHDVWSHTMLLYVVVHVLFRGEACKRTGWSSKNMTWTSCMHLQWLAHTWEMWGKNHKFDSQVCVCISICVLCKYT